MCAVNNQLESDAVRLGAVSMRVFRIKKYEYGVGHIWNAFSYHFFNRYDEEICYYIDDLKELGMFVFQTPRIWSDLFKNSEEYEFVKLY